jgi:general secretion pathway protein C
VQRRATEFSFKPADIDLMNSTLKPSNLFTQLGALSGPQWAELGIKYAPQVVAGLAVIGIAWQAARLTWLVLTPNTIDMTSQNNAAPIAATQIAPVASVNPQSIADAHLFGMAGATNGPADPNSLPQTQAPLVLAGTMAFDDPEAGFAIVGETAVNAKFYRVGAMINGGIRLHGVYADRVIIDRGGTLETLVLPRGAPSTAPAPVARNVVTTSVGENLRRIASSNPGALGELLRAQPVFANGTQKGYRIYPGRDRQQFARLGLQPGDLVTAINGAALDDPNRGNEILNTLTASTTAQVTIERNGSTQQISLDMAQVTLPDAAADGSASSTNSVAAPSGPGSGVIAPPLNRGLRSNRSGGVPNVTPDASTQ